MTYFGDDGCGYETPGDAKAAPDVPPYPPEWDAEQRSIAYWFALGHRLEIRSTASWRHILADAQRKGGRRHDKIAAILADPDAPQDPDLTAPAGGEGLFG